MDHGKDHWPSQTSLPGIPYMFPYANPLRHTEAAETEKYLSLDLPCLLNKAEAAIQVQVHG